jgi:hypothetical protein
MLGVGLEDGARTLTLSTNNATHLCSIKYEPVN